MKDYISNIISTKNPKVYNIFFKQIPIDKLIAETMFLPVDCLPGQRLYHIHNSLSSIPICPICDDVNMWKGTGLYSLAGYQKTCGNKDCLSLYRKTINSPSQNVTRKYGVDNISQTQEWRDKVKETNLERRGVEWNTQDKNFIERSNFVRSENKESVLNKRIETNLKKYGVEHATQNDIVKNKVASTCIERYGVSHPMQNQKILEKAKATSIKNYGNWYLATDEAKTASIMYYKDNYDVTHNSHISSVIAKRYKKKEYRLPSGKMIFLQGNEGLALDILLKLHGEDDIITDAVQMETYIGKIKYFTEDGIEHRYYPDIFIKSLSMIIEVKSLYTYNYAKEINELKKLACINKGFSFNFMIIN